MRIVFNGLLEKKSGGCNCKRNSAGYGFVNSRTYILPSGRSKTFIAGKEETVTDRDGKFLLSYNKAPDVNGHSREVFTKVGD